jgi:anti-sigma B factor antagonist
MDLLTLIPLDDGVPGFRLVGELDLSTAPVLTDALGELETDGSIVLDLQELTFIDSSGIHAIFVQAMAREGQLVLANPSVEIVRTLEIMGIADHPQLQVRDTGADSHDAGREPGDK